MQLILGSQSPRRKEILGYFSLPFTQITPPYDEELISFNGDPIHYAQTFAKGKALSLAHLHPKALIITADTVVFKDGKSYGKPKNKEEGFQSLLELSGQWHTVYTAVSVCQQHQPTNILESHGIESTRVLFNPMTPQQIHSYQEQLHCDDKAGGYFIQSAGAIIVRRIEGCYYNVMGLPINTLRELLTHFGIDLWNHLK